MSGGLYGSLLTPDHTIDPGRWARARDAGELVGQCRRQACDGYLTVDDPPLYGGADMRWHHARCLKCGSEVVAPGGRVLRRSAWLSERPGRK